MNDKNEYPSSGNALTPVDPGLGEILAVLKRRRWILLVVIAPAMLLAAGVLALLTPRYSAETLVLIESQPANIVTLQSVVAGLTGDAESVQSEAYVLGSRALADRVIRRLGLERDPEFNSALDEEDSGPDSADPELAAAQEYSAVVDKFLDRLTVSPRETSRVISVSFSSEQPAKAAEITNILADEYILSRLEAKYESTQRANAWLGVRVQELRREVETAERAVEEARREYGLIESNGLTLSSQELAELNTQLVMARTARAEAEARLGQVQRLTRTRGGASTASEVLDSPLIQRLREQQAEVERRVAELSSEFGERHPKMIQLRAESDDLQKRIDGEVNKIVTGLRNQVNVARARERTLESSLEELKVNVAQSNQNEIQLRALEREAEANRALLATMLARQKETMSQEDLDFQQPDARIISAADVPVEPSFPQPAVVLSLVFIGSGIIGLLLILVLELIDGGFRSGEQLEQATGVASLGFVPKVTPPKDYRTLPGYVAGRPSTAFGESIRTLNWSLKLAFAERAPQVVLITSSVPGEGKTTVASCYATMQSIAGQKVVLIDADTRKPSCNDLLGVEREPGLVDALVGEISIEQALKTSEWSGLSVIPAGMPTPNAPNLLGSKKMEALLDTLRERFDLIVIDSPPVMAAADARILCRLADATVMIVRWGRTRREVVRLALRQLHGANARLAGCLLSAVDSRKHAQYSYGDSGAYTGDLEKYYVG